MRIATVLLVAVGLASAAVAETTPLPGVTDPHIQTVTYDPQQVVALKVAAGFATTIVFSPEERIETVTVGDSGAWQVQVNRRADRLVVKPVGYAATTNLTVMSDQRSYNFTLYATSPGEIYTPYQLSFTYPAPPSTGEATAQEASAGRYRLKGSKRIFPAQIGDDGETTSIVWPEDVRLPAVYQEEQRGNPALVNGVMQDGAYRIQGVYGRLLFLLGREKAVATRQKAERERD